TVTFNDYQRHVHYSAGSCYVAYVANTWSSPVTIKAWYGTEELDTSGSVFIAKGSGLSLVYEAVTGPLPPGEVGLVFLSEWLDDPGRIACPGKALKGVETFARRNSRGSAFRLTTDRPVGAYTIFPYGGAPSFLPSATLLLPAASWGKDYVLL